MIKIVTIGGGNGQSNLLSALHEYLVTEMNDVEIASIVSMSDDGRTTGNLMRLFRDELGLHLPPPGDLRRCLFMVSGSKRRDQFQQYLETVIQKDVPITELKLEDYFRLVGASDAFIEHIDSIHSGIGNYSLPLTGSVKGHKVGNILMACLYYNLGKNYDSMLDLMHEILEVQANIIPVTTKKAYIKAILGNGEVIETQDRISNVASYSAGIADLELMEDSKDAYQNKSVYSAVMEADYVIISPGDLFTSTISNFVIGGVANVIRKTDAKIIYIGNNTNKGGETQGLTCLDFINKIERFLCRRIDIFICNNRKLELTEAEKERFQNSVSVKGGDFLYLSEGEKSELKRRKIEFIEADLLDSVSLYKHDKKMLAQILQEIIA